MKPYIDISGQSFGRLKVIKFLMYKNYGNFGKTRSIFLCLCSCGIKKEFAASNLVSGNTKSCGCLNKESRKKREFKSTHSMSLSTEYKIYASMKRRCYNKNEKSYKDYGGRGITVCDEWKNSFEQFYKDMGPRPSKVHSLDRIDNEKCYSDFNCVWNTRLEQANNKRSNRILIFDNVSHTLAQWSRIFFIDSETISRRIKRGWSIKDALTKPLQMQKRNYSCGG